MPLYQPFLIPLVKTAGSPHAENQITTPLEEELWLVRSCQDSLDWNDIADRAKQAYGMELVHLENSLETGKCSLSHCPECLPLRHFLYHGNPGKFAIEHPTQLIDYDRLCSTGHTPVLVRPSIFTHIYSSLMGNRITSEVALPDSETATLAFEGELQRLLKQMPSDWHLEPMRNSFRERLRHDGVLGPASQVSREKGIWYLNSLRRACGLDGSVDFQPLDGSFSLTDTSGTKVSLRLSLIPTIHGLSAAVRFLYQDEHRLNSLASLGMSHPQQTSITDQWRNQNGLFLVCGPTGSGKTTTLHVLLQMAARQRKKVLSAEDPVERVLAGVQQVQVTHQGYATVLKAFMRQAPDTIMIGEIRDHETAETVLQSAYSGHQIIATIHTASTTGMLHRFEDFGINPSTVREVLQFVIHQRLVRNLCNACKAMATVNEEWITRINSSTGLKVENPLRKATGCALCKTGYAGQSAIFSVESGNDPFETNCILEKESVSLLANGRIDMKTAISCFKLPLRKYFSFH